MRIGFQYFKQGGYVLLVVNEGGAKKLPAVKRLAQVAQFFTSA